MNELIRAQFEKWFSDNGASPRAVERAGDGYRLMQAQTSWTAWQAAIAALQAQGEAVGEVYTMEALTPGGEVKCHVALNRPLPAGAKLYTHPAPQQAVVPDEWVLVPRNPVTAIPMLRALSVAAGMEPLPAPNSEGGYPITGRQFTALQWYEALLAAAPQPPQQRGAGQGVDCNCGCNEPGTLTLMSNNWELPNG